MLYAARSPHYIASKKGDNCQSHKALMNRNTYMATNVLIRFQDVTLMWRLLCQMEHAYKH